MAIPIFNSVGKDLRDALDPLAYEDDRHAYALGHFLNGVGVLLSEINDYVREGPSNEPGWSSLLDIDRAPVKGLPWLGQFAGATLPGGLTDQQKRDLIRDGSGLRRGTPAALAAAARAYLVGNKTVILRERDTSPYHLSVFTYDFETPTDPVVGSPAFTLQGTEITDALRAAGVEGDGRLVPDSSFGLWEASTNIHPNGGAETNINNWAVNAGTLTRDTTTSKFGAACFKGVSGVENNYLTSSVNISGATTGRVFTGSFWIKGSGSTVGKSAGILMSEVGGATGEETGTTVTLTLTANWQRITATRTLVRNDRTQVRLYVLQQVGAVAGDVIFFDGVQIEEKRFATPYIHTNGTALTRNQGYVTGSGSAQKLDKRQGWFAVYIRAGTNSSDAPGVEEWPSIFGWGTAWWNGIRIMYVTPYWYIQRLGGDVYPVYLGQSAISADTFSKGDYRTIIGAWTSTGVKISINGSPFVAGTGTNDIPHGTSPDTFLIGKQLAGTSPVNGELLWAAAGKGTLTDADAADIHAAAVLGGKLWKDMPKGAVTTFLWGADNATYQMGSSINTIIAAALGAAKPAGLVLSYSMVSGGTYGGLLAGYTSYQAVLTAFTTYQGVLNNVPGT